MMASSGGRAPRSPSPKRISPDSPLRVKTFMRLLISTGAPGGLRPSRTGTSGPASVKSPISVHSSDRFGKVTVRRTEPGSTGVFDNVAVWSGAPVPTGNSSLVTRARWATAVALTPAHNNLASAAAVGRAAAPHGRGVSTLLAFRHGGDN